MRAPFRRPRTATAAWTLAVLTFVDSARRARRGRVGRSEERVFRWFNRRSDRIAVPVWTVMQSGSLTAVFVVAGAVARRGRRRSALATAVCGTTIWACVKLVKPAVRRGRPDDHLADVVVRGRRQNGLGYPSGHAAVALALTLMTPAALGTPHRRAHDVVALGLGGLAGAARMYVGAHLPLDVAGGLAIGALTGHAALTIVDHAGRCEWPV